MITVQSHLVTPVGYIRPTVENFPSEREAKRFAWDNWTIARYNNQYVARTSSGIKEFVYHAWDSNTGALSFTLA